MCNTMTDIVDKGAISEVNVEYRKHKIGSLRQELRYVVSIYREMLMF